MTQERLDESVRLILHGLRRPEQREKALIALIGDFNRTMNLLQASATKAMDENIELRRKLSKSVVSA